MQYQYAHSAFVKVYRCCGLEFPVSAANPVLKYASSRWLFAMRNKKGVIAALKERRAWLAAHPLTLRRQSRMIELADE